MIHVARQTGHAVRMHVDAYRNPWDVTVKWRGDGWSLTTAAGNIHPYTTRFGGIQAHPDVASELVNELYHDLGSHMRLIYIPDFLMEEWVQEILDD